MDCTVNFNLHHLLSVFQYAPRLVTKQSWKSGRRTCPRHWWYTLQLATEMLGWKDQRHHGRMPLSIRFRQHNYLRMWSFENAQSWVPNVHLKTHLDAIDPVPTFNINPWYIRRLRGPKELPIVELAPIPAPEVFTLAMFDIQASLKDVVAPYCLEPN